MHPIVIFMAKLWLMVTTNPPPYNGPIACPQYKLPCDCPSSTYVYCNKVPLADIQAAFRRSRYNISTFRLAISQNEMSLIPADLLGLSQAENVRITCLSDLPQLVIDDKAFRSSNPVIRHLTINECNLENQQNFGFMKGFKVLETFIIFRGRNFNSFEGLPSQTKLESISISFSEGFENLADGPEIALPGLQKLNLERNSLNDVAMAKILKILTGSSKSSLINLNFKNNRLTRVPEQILSFTNLNLISLERNAISVIKTNSLDFTGKFNLLYLDENDISSIEPNAFGFAFGAGISKTPILFRTHIIIFMTKNNLTRLDSYVFQPLLERTEGSFSIGINENPIECDCHLAWLIVHNRHLLTAIDGVTCSDSTDSLEVKSLSDLNPIAFRDCPIFTCPTGFDGNFLNPISNSSYYTCSSGNSVLLECPRGRSFNLASQICG